MEQATQVNGHRYDQSSTSNGTTTNTRSGAKGKGSDNTTIAKKRKLGASRNGGSPIRAGCLYTRVYLLTLFTAANYDEEDEGFMFTRAKTRKSRATEPSSQPAEPTATNEISKSNRREEAPRADVDEVSQDVGKRTTKKKMTFSTPNTQESKPTRRSRRISGEDAQPDGSPQKRRRKDNVDPVKPRGQTPEVQAATKITLPFADTPVIRRNKAMREGRGSKGERRSSLGLRGRRASSLIDSGTSNGECSIPLE